MNIEKESQKDIKANLISRKNILLIIIAILFSPSILIIRLLVLKIGKIENKKISHFDQYLSLYNNWHLSEEFKG